MTRLFLLAAFAAASCRPSIPEITPDLTRLNTTIIRQYIAVQRASSALGKTNDATAIDDRQLILDARTASAEAEVRLSAAADLVTILRYVAPNSVRSEALKDFGRILDGHAQAIEALSGDVERTLTRLTNPAAAALAVQLVATLKQARDTLSSLVR